jgi:hypothetical protein
MRYRLQLLLELFFADIVVKRGKIQVQLGHTLILVEHVHHLELARFRLRGIVIDSSGRQEGGCIYRAAVGVLGERSSGLVCRLQGREAGFVEVVLVI